MPAIKSTPSSRAPTPALSTNAPSTASVTRRNSSPTAAPPQSPTSGRRTMESLAHAPGHWDNSQFGAPSRQLSRTQSLPALPSTGAPAPRPPWSVRPDVAQFNQDIVKDNPGTKLTQTIDQSSCPGANGGICTGMTTDWIKQNAKHSSPTAGSAAFNNSLHTNVQGMKDTQNQHSGRLDSIRNDAKATHAVHAGHLEEQAQLHKRYAEASKMSPKEQKKLIADFNDLESRMTANGAKMTGHTAKLESAERKEAELMGGGLKHTPVAQHKPITEDFASDLHAATQKPGLYSLSVHSSTPGASGHVMGMQVNKDGTTKFMDPNTAEFTMKNHTGMVNVVTEHVGSIYMKDDKFNKFSVSHYEP